ncbi:ZAR1-like protein [Boleophthalmus pectinirostris]|uniref:ZAR1-like protein n=1 Tax=Boleophthalmus pectinirostris TaxID=150288 RepID=UPI000A1C370A|nr:ZAR1-like protein [Boleophthalmus pectinirostris]
MEGFLSTFPPFGFCGVPGPSSGWGKREGRLITPHGLNYLELCKALLSQASPTVHPQHKKANTKDCGVQVNAKVHKLIQCSLGPKTLFSRDTEGPLSPKSTKSPDVFLADGTPPVSHLRFLRPVSIYSPVFDRRLLLKKLSVGDDSELDTAELEDSVVTEEHSEDEPVKVPDTSLHLASKGSSLQFLEQRYGFFHCKKCNVRWESAYVWCISGTSKVYFKQLCRKCQVGFNPYRVESILCKGCAQTSCVCERKQRHINMKRPHRQDLCCRCKGMKLSCEATYSFKYIV